MGRSNDEERSSCCTWIKIGSVFVVLVVTGILIWQFAPVDEVIERVVPTFNNSGIFNGGNNDRPSGDSPTAAPAPSPQEEYSFNQCVNPEENCCNGLDNGICDLRVNEIVYATSHNANAAAETGFFVSPNHQYKLEDSLTAGYRGINLDVCNCGGALTLCHGICAFGTRDIVEVLFNINDFLDRNPSEVLIIPLELNSEVDQAVDIFQLYELMQEVPGFIEKFYVHSGISDPWPTLGQLVETNQRVIVFHTRGPACDVAEECPVGMHWYPRYASNTQFSLANLNDLSNNAQSCTFTRTPGIASKTFFGLNHFVTPPSPSTSQTLNEYTFMTDRINTCSSLNEDLEVNFVYVDFWETGDLPRLVQDLNTAKVLQRKLEVERQ